MLTRLPVQHRGKPHCPACKVDLPTMDDVQLITPTDLGVELLAVTFTIRCRCGARWNIGKTVSHLAPEPER